MFAVLGRALLVKLDGIAADLQRADIAVMLVKGADLARRCYPRHLPRAMRDLDLLVRRKDARAAARVIAARGFSNGPIDARALAIVEIPEAVHRELQRGHYEFLPFSRLIAMPALERYRQTLRYISRRTASSSATDTCTT